MGNSSCQPRPATLDANGNRLKPMKEKDRYGVCTVKIMSVAPAQGARRNQERVTTTTITPKGAIIHGSQCNPQLIQRALASSGFPFLVPSEIALQDSRAHKLLVIYNDGWHAIPSPEPFSRHTGTCIVLGDRTATSPPYKIKLGDCFRLGSVGLVVAEMRVFNGEEQRLDPQVLQYLKEETMTMDMADDVAALAADENDHCDRLSMKDKDKDARNDGYSVATDVAWNEEHGGVGGGERFICYMCYETHDTPEDPLVAPCECKGDTRYLHVHCLQRWYQSSVLGPQSQVIRTTGNGAPACKICGSAYKTAFRKADGRKANLLEIESNRPYLSLIVVTRHDTNPGLFNTKFRLNFGRSSSDMLSDLMDNENQLLIGRSSSCNMILDYRTVSTVHAQISYEDGNFYMVDKRSSNGTMAYLQEPLALQFQQPVRLRMGRTTLTVQTKRSMTATVREMFTARRGGAAASSATAQRSGYLSPTELQALLVVSSAEQLQAAAQNGAGGTGWNPGTFMGMVPRGAGAASAASGSGAGGADPNGPVVVDSQVDIGGGMANDFNEDAAPDEPLVVKTASYGLMTINQSLGECGQGGGDFSMGNLSEESQFHKMSQKDRSESGISSDVAAGGVATPKLEDGVVPTKHFNRGSTPANDNGINGFEMESAAFLDGNGTYTYADQGVTNEKEGTAVSGLFVRGSNTSPQPGSRKNSAGSVRGPDDAPFGSPKQLSFKETHSSDASNSNNNNNSNNSNSAGIAAMYRSNATDISSLDNATECNSTRMDDDDVVIRVRVRKGTNNNNKSGTSPAANGGAPSSPSLPLDSSSPIPIPLSSDDGDDVDRINNGPPTAATTVVPDNSTLQVSPRLA